MRGGGWRFGFAAWMWALGGVLLVLAFAVGGLRELLG